MKVRLVNVQYVKDFSPINDNLPSKYVELAIDLSHDKDLRALIGSPFYDDLIEKVQTANGVIASLSAAYQALVTKEEFKAYLAWSTLAQGTLWMHYKIQPKSIATKGGDGAETADNYSIDKIQDEAKNNAEFYGQRVLYWLRENSTDYPLLDQCGDLDTPRTSYDSGLSLGNKRPNGRRGNYNTIYRK